MATTSEHTCSHPIVVSAGSSCYLKCKVKYKENDEWTYITDLSQLDGKTVYLFLVSESEEVTWSKALSETENASCFNNGVFEVLLTPAETLSMKGKICKMQIAIKSGSEVLSESGADNDIAVFFKPWEAGEWLQNSN